MRCGRGAHRVAVRGVPTRLRSFPGGARRIPYLPSRSSSPASGSYALAPSIVDVAQAVGAGLLGYLAIAYNYSIVAFIVGLVLGPIIEENVHRSLSLGDVGIFVGSPLRIVLVALIVGSLVGPVALSLRNRYRAAA